MVGLLLTVGCITPPPTTESYIYISPSNLYIDTGEYVNVSVYLEVNTNINAFEFEVIYDRLILEYSGYEWGTIWSNQNGFYSSPNFSEHGVIKDIFGLLLGNETSNTSGVVIKLKFKGLEEGYSDINIMKINIYKGMSPITNSYDMGRIYVYNNLNRDWSYN